MPEAFDERAVPSQVMDVLVPEHNLRSHPPQKGVQLPLLLLLQQQQQQ